MLGHRYVILPFLPSQWWIVDNERIALELEIMKLAAATVAARHGIVNIFGVTKVPYDLEFS
jgi:sarcosine oxidase gamma subunit